MNARLLAILALMLWVAAPADAAVGEPSLDRPTTEAIGVRVPVTGDATATVRYRRAGTTPWKAGPSLYRVHPEVLRPGAAVDELAGSIFGLRPGTRYDVELKLPDRTVALQAATRALPRTSPAHPRRRPVRTAAALSAALASARPGDVIELAPGIYRGSFSLQASGTTDDPIVVRGRSARRSIIDGQGCTGCNILETYGSHVHVERLTLRHGMRGFKNQGGGTTDLAVRHVRILDTTLGIGVRTRSFDSYICDNLLRGRLRWPKTYATDGGAHSSDEGIVVWGEGHVVCHNDVAGYGDALNVGEGDRADDFFGNEVRWSYDNAVELDFAQGNVRLWQNRFENTYSPISTQPVDGGPAYVVRNVVVNMVDEPLKFHANGVGAGADEPSGMLVWNNTFVSPVAALLMQTPAAAHWFDVRNNIFMGPPPKVSRFWPSTVEWSGRIDHGVFDHDGYWPDGRFKFGDIRAPDLAVLRRPGLEQHGVVLSSGTFAHIRPLRTSRRLLAPLDAALSATSPARRRGVPIPGITAGTAPDLGALQRGSPRPRYGVRP